MYHLAHIIARHGRLPQGGDVQPDDYRISKGGVVVWKCPELHPLLGKTDTDHPDLLRKASEVFPIGEVGGLPKICSENSEDACTWFYFSPLLDDPTRKGWVLARLLREAFPNQISPQLFALVPQGDIKFWRDVDPPSSRIIPEGPTEVDVILTVGTLAVIFVEAKYKSGLSERTAHDATRDQVIRNLDVGSAFARAQGFERFYFLVLQYGDYPINAKEFVSRYSQRPNDIKEKLYYRDDLSEEDFDFLSKSIGYVCWPDPLSWDRVLGIHRP